MALSNIETKINELLRAQYKMQGITLTAKDIKLVKYAINEVAGENCQYLRLDDKLLSTLSEQAISISQKIGDFRFFCRKLAKESLISPEESLPHLSALDQLLENKEIQAPQEITPDMIAEYIVDSPTDEVVAKVDELQISDEIAGLSLIHI